jgi:UDP-N-acetylmuramyl tripeptide synthase
MNMNLKLRFTIALSKIIIRALRLAKRGGTTLPGKIALKIYPNIIKEMTKDFKIIMVTGTNGKTTTSRIIGQVLSENNIEFISNKSGANLVSGIVTTFLDSVSLKGRFKVSYALLEIDEAAFKIISNHIKPDILVVTNFFRDQLDRYGELYTTLNGVKTGIGKLQETKLILNADDSLCASIGKNVPNEVLYYGINSDAHTGIDESINSDAMFCIFCKTKYQYTSHIYGHLGQFSCPSCGYSRPDTGISCTKVVELNTSYSLIKLNPESSPGYERTEVDTVEDGFEAKVNLPGLYNIYNALAAVSCGYLLGLPIENTIRALGNFECGFGRMETIYVGSKKIKLILVKNPTGFNQVLNYLLTEDKNMQLAFLLNDNLADGTDISWIWDVDFEKLNEIQEKICNTYTSGVRAEDMAVRLKYAGIYTDKINIIKDYRELIETGLSKTPESHSFYILPTYTAMTDIRKILKDKYKLKEFWK